jgi:hypothetical protein
MGGQWVLLALIAAIVVLVIPVIRTGAADLASGRAGAGSASRVLRDEIAAAEAPVFCLVCERPMDEACARCAGPACATCDHCFGCRHRVCFSCDLAPTPPFWLPGDQAPHPHNDTVDA